MPVASSWIVPPLPCRVTKPLWPVGATPLIKAAVSVIDCNLLVFPQPRLNTSSAQIDAAKRVLRVTAKYLQKGIFRIVAASVTRDKVTKVMAPHRGEGLSVRRFLGRS